jgi:hypothetical protein
MLIAEDAYRKRSTVSTLNYCTFCGKITEFPECYGTCYGYNCDCGMSHFSIQICDLMTIKERCTQVLCKENNYRYDEQYIERAKQEFIKQWNTRI